MLSGRAGNCSSQAAFEDLFDIPAAVNYGSDLYRLRVGSIHDQIRVDGEKLHSQLRQILAAVPSTRGSSEKSHSFANGGFNAVRYRDVGLFFDVTPDFDEIERGLGRKNVAQAHLDLAFQFRQVSFQLIVRDSFAAVELLDAASDLCVDCFPVFQKPAVLFFLGLQQAEQYFFDAARASRLELFFDSRLKSRIVDFDIHGLILQKGIALSFHRI